MDETFAKELSKKLQIDIEQIVREEYEMVFLKKLFESKIGKDLIFKGGMALRLCFGSPRFSQDLDFSLKRRFSQKDFFEIINSFSKEFTQVRIDDLFSTKANTPSLAKGMKRCSDEVGTLSETNLPEGIPRSLERGSLFSKRFTFFALLKVKEDYLPRAFSIKIEVSKRKEIWKEGKNFQITVVKSEITPITFLGQIANLEKILEDKLDIIKRRKQPRDLFDIWFICQKLKPKDIKIPFYLFKKIQLKRELHKFLPKSWHKVIDLWEKEGKLK